MTEIQEGTIPMSDAERAAIASIPNVIGYSRTLPNEQGPIQVESKDGALWLVKGSRVERIG